VITGGPIGSASLNSKLEQAPSCSFNIMNVGYAISLWVQIQNRKDVFIFCFVEGLKPNLNLCLKLSILRNYTKLLVSPLKVRNCVSNFVIFTILSVSRLLFQIVDNLLY
jgi:hypothetical protein